MLSHEQLRVYFTETFPEKRWKLRNGNMRGVGVKYDTMKHRFINANVTIMDGMFYLEGLNIYIAPRRLQEIMV